MDSPLSIQGKEWLTVSGHEALSFAFLDFLFLLVYNKKDNLEYFLADYLHPSRTGISCFKRKYEEGYIYEG